MQTYQSTPDYYRDYIQHGWLKDQAAKVHKYISRWRGKNGKWYYSYKSKAQELGTKINRKLSGADADQISLNYGKEPIYGYAHDNARTFVISQRACIFVLCFDKDIDMLYRFRISV